MNHHKFLTLGVLILALGLALLLGGCSEFGPPDEGITASGESTGNVEVPPNNLTHYQYPEAANYPPEGWQFVELDPSAERTTDAGTWVYAYIPQSVGGQLWLTGSGVVIQPYGIPYSSWIGEYKPSRNSLWVEFEPHGLIFVSQQYGRVSYKNCKLPAGVTPEELAVFYWNDMTQQYEYIGGTNNLADQYLEFNLEHFSRYVVAGSN